jgi:hypothetical protein
LVIHAQAQSEERDERKTKCRENDLKIQLSITFFFHLGTLNTEKKNIPIEKNGHGKKLAMVVPKGTCR